MAAYHSHEQIIIIFTNIAVSYDPNIIGINLPGYYPKYT